jgi:digeranylgeranylglycerophospholipid reductase
MRILPDYLSDGRNFPNFRHFIATPPPQPVGGKIMKRLETDVLVVGAGPGGSMAAKFAARGGARVLLIEKRQEIGSPVRCAEGVALNWMKECDVALDPRWVACTPQGARLFGPNGTCALVSAERAGNHVGVVVERTLFDKALAQQAAEAGARILLKTYASSMIMTRDAVGGIAGKTMGEDIEIRAKITIAADGYESQIARWSGLDTSLKPNDIISAIQYRLCNVQNDDRYCDFYVGSCAPGGYLWSFPKGPGVANVGIGIPATKLHEPGQVKTYLDRWIAQHPAYANGQILEMVAGGVSLNKPLPKTTMDGMMLVGDAARVINPVTGGGIVHACITGKLAGEIAAEAIHQEDFSEKFLRKYEKAWRDRFEKRLKRNWLVKEKIHALEDDDFNRIVDTLAEEKPEINTVSLLMALARKHPALVARFSSLIWS